ncbi:uncharacterized protein Tco025E_05389 [Trypanosoma conorhini]|uniref:Dynein heavy chain n=1 Tax=Trypanosoma conorhini TaxID=83891 RepID=A0A422PDK5_9TRYP|nr:uncharacterized protein Tco025E_05389 [Trypanosoma conorhini]RNF15773.1 hypothetical protein Tco025E_05389 [Trypanosoma conorhini]
MDLQHESSVTLRFERVIAYFLDGIPRPFLQIVSGLGYGVTFDFCSVGVTPDYTGLTESAYFPELRESQLFDPLCSRYCNSSTPSSRIGCHYSPYIGTFRFNGKGVYFKKEESGFKQRIVRFPTETCEERGTMSSKSDRDLRASLFIDFYEKIAEKHLVHDRGSLRRIVILATQGMTAEYKSAVEQVVAEIKRLYIRACGQSMYQYMNENIQFRRIISSLCLGETENLSVTSKKVVTSEDARFELALQFKLSVTLLKESLPWGKRTHQFFTRLQDLWVNRFDKLAIFNISTNQWTTSADSFLAQLGSSMRAAFTRIRVEFYTQLEMLLFSGIRGSRQFIFLDSQMLNGSDLKRIFLAVRVFLVNGVRTLVVEALQDLVHFFTGLGDDVIPISRARKTPLIEVQLTVSDSGLPCSPSFASLRFGLADLLDELLDSFNNLPTPEAVIMRTLDFERCTLNSFDADELSLKGVLMNSLDAAGSRIEELTREYARFATLPPINGAYFSRANETSIQNQVHLLRETIGKIAKTSPDVVVSGCIAINCTEVKKWYVEHWTTYLEKYLAALKSDLLSYITTAVENYRCQNACLNKEPKTVEELEEFCRVVAETEILSNKVKQKDCNQVIGWFNCLEILQIPVENQLYAIALELMRCPNELMQLASESLEICTKSKPFIIEKLGEFRNSIRRYVQMISDGVDELLSLFNLDVCDIAAQTCEELRVIVDKVLKGIEHIKYCEKALEIESVDSFEDFFPILRIFDVLEQFWDAVFESTAVREYYNQPINMLNATKMIDYVQRCRRLLHSSTRGLRAYPGLVRLGRQQEHVLAEFESLEGILICITAPGLRKNHWKEISRIIGKDVNTKIQIDSSSPLQLILESRIQSHFDELKQIVDPATVDFETEASLERMKSEAKRTRFVFNVIEGTEGVFALSPLCRDSISSQLETFLLDLRMLRQQVSVSQYVVNSINEWELAVERMRTTLSNWTEIEYEWLEAMYFGMTLDAIAEGETPALGGREWKFLHEKIGSVNGIFSVLSTALQKTQYTLFTAMIQENIQEQLTLASTILSDIRKVVMGLLDAKRESFPRFYFLSDGELSSFVSVLDNTRLTQLLSKMYSRVCDVGVERNAVTTFITADGAILKAEEPIKLSAIPIDRWMKTFEATLRSSLLHELQACVESHYHVDAMNWLRGSCVQIAHLALRIIHNRDLLEALSLAGGMGVSSYATRLKDLMEEYLRLAAAPMESGERKLVSSVITFFLCSRREVQLAIKAGIQTKEDLNKTAMIHTFMENDKIYVETLGFRLPYGMEFLGNYTIPVLAPEYIERGLYSVFVSFAASSVPIIIGAPARAPSSQYCAEFLGRFWWCLQCHPTLTLEGILQGLRGALGVGAIFCLKDIDLLARHLVFPITNLLRSIEAASQLEKRPSDGGFDKIALEADGTTKYVQKDPCFQMVLTTTTIDKIPTSLSLTFRPIHVIPVDLTVVTQLSLYVLGVSKWMTLGQGLALMYAQLIEFSPTIFTTSNLLAVTRAAMELSKGAVIVRFCISFLHQFWQAIESNEPLQKLVEWNMLHTLGVSQDSWVDALVQVEAASGFEALLDRFTRFMTVNPNVVLVGPDYSGKTRLWRRWVGDLHHAVISFRLVNCTEIYGDACRPGLLSAIAKHWDPLVTHAVVIEDADFSQVSIVFDAPAFARVRPYSGPDFIKGPAARLIAVTPELNTANPRVIADFSLFAVPAPTRWKTFFRELLATPPSYHAGVAYAVMITLIDYILDTRHTVKRAPVSYENLFAVASRCSQLYKKWYSYAKSRCVSREEWITDRAFALQCAVFAVCWSLGWRLPAEERQVLQTVLEKSQLKLSRVAKEIGFTEDVLPPLEDDVLLYIATPVGWRKIDNAATTTAEAGFAPMWTRKWDGVGTYQRTWSQFFPFPSRETTLTALEYLIDAGQSVLIVGGQGQGKSAILRQMGSNRWWVHQLVCNSTACRPLEITEALQCRMTLRQSKSYGPSIGRKLVLCVDDVSLAGKNSSSPVMHLFSFINRFSAICTLSRGYIPIDDLVCVGTAAPDASFDVAVENAVVQLRLPELEDAEVVGAVEKLFEAVCAERRGVTVSTDISAFLAAAQLTAIRLMPTELGGAQASEGGVVALPMHQGEEGVPQQQACDSSFAFNLTNKARTSYLHLFLKISDRALRFLANSWDDPGTAKIILNAVYAFYANMIDDNERQRGFESELTELASTRLKNCFGNERVSLGVLQEETAVEEKEGGTDLPPCTSGVVQEWLRAYEEALQSNAIEEPPNVDTGGIILFSPPSLLQRRMPANLPGILVAPRLSHANYTSQWTSRLISALHQYLRQQQTHVALVGRYDNGIRRALRVWGSSVRTHVAFLRDNYANDDADGRFKKDLMEIIQHICRNEGRLVVFVPNCVLGLAWPMGSLDAIVRSGDVTQLFTLEGLLFLLHGRRGVRRGSGGLTPAEYSELTQRICKRLCIVTHILSYGELKRLGDTIPLISSMIPVSLRAPEMLWGLVHALLQTEEANRQVMYEAVVQGGNLGRTVQPLPLGPLELAGRPLTQLLCDVFDVMKTELSLGVEQLLEFGFQTQRLRYFLERLRRESAQSRHITELPTAIRAKMREYKENIEQKSESVKAAIQRQIKKLRARAKSEEERMLRHQNAAAHFRHEAEQIGALIMREEGGIQTQTGNMTSTLTTMGSRLAAVKVSQIKQFAKLPHPPKGLLLMRAVCKVIGEELRATSGKGMWELGKAIVTSPKFIPRLLAVAPGTMKYETFAQLHTSLREVRYAEISPFAGAIADYLLALMESTRLGEMVKETNRRLGEMRLDYSDSLSKADAAERRAQRTSARLEDDRAEVTRLLRRSEDMDAMKNDGIRRQHALGQLYDIVDGFSAFHSPEETAARETFAEKGEGSVIMVAAHRAFFAMLPMEQQTRRFRQLQSLLSAWGIAAPTDLEDPMVALLFRSINDITDDALVSTCSTSERLCVGTLLQRVYFRWPFFAGVSPTFESVLQHYLKIMCGGCVVTSALSKDFTKQLLEAATQGDGLLICDASASFVLHELRPLLALQPTLREAMVHKQLARVSLYGENVEVKSSFYVVCVSPATVACDRQGNLVARFMSITNFFLTPDVGNLVQTTLLQSPLTRNAVEEKYFGSTPGDDEHPIEAFSEALHEASALLCEDLDFLTGDGRSKIERLGVLVKDLNGYHVRVLRAESHHQTRKKRLQESWRSIRQAICSVERSLSVIEAGILGRRWEARKLEPFILSASELMRPYQSRIAPNSFEMLAESHKEFYATVNFLDRVVQVLGGGWPCEFRGIFAWYVLSGVIVHCDFLLRLRGQLYSPLTTLLNAEQYKVLHCLLDRGNRVVDEAYVRDAYAASSDALLKGVVSDLASFTGDLADFRLWAGGDGTRGGEEMVRHFFYCWAKLNYTSCDLVASRLYNAFLFAVKEQSSEGESEVSTLYDYVGNVPAAVHSPGEWLRFSLGACLPLCLVSTSVQHITGHYERYFKAAKLSCHHCRVSTPEDVDQLMETVSVCFRTRPADQGHCVMAVLAVPEAASEQAAFIQALSTYLSRYCRYGVWDAVRSGTAERFPVLLSLVLWGSPSCEKDLYGAMRHNNACAQMLEEWCLTLMHEASFVRFYLLSLLQDEGVFPPWHREGTTLMLERPASSSASEKKRNSSGRGGSRAPACAKMSNVIELHTGLVSGQIVLRSLWQKSACGATLPPLWHATVDRDDLTLLLRVMAKWVRNERAMGVDIRRRRSLRLLGRRDSKPSTADTVYSGLSRSPQALLENAFNKLAFAIYAARMTTSRFRTCVVELLRQRASLIATEGGSGREGRSLSLSVAIEEASKAGTSETGFLAELRHSDDDFHVLCGDEPASLAYRDLMDAALQRLLYGTSGPPALVKAESSEELAPATAEPTTSAEDSEQAPRGEIMQLLFLWEKGHMQELLSGLKKRQGQSAAVSRVQAAMRQLSSWVPGETLTVWLPALQHPRLLLHAFASRALSRRADDISSVEMVLVLARRFSLLHDDIILAGAAPSEQLEEEVLFRTDWDAAQMAWRKGADAAEQEEDIVLAVRFQKSLSGGAAEAPLDVLWEVLPGEKKIYGLSPVVSRGSGAFLTETSMGSPYKLLEVRSTCPMPVVCASAAPTAATAGAGEVEWALLFDMPLHVIWLGSDSPSRRQKSVVGAAGQSTPGTEFSSTRASRRSMGEAPSPSTFVNSLSFFVTIS